jgi:hypothetical protein
MVKLLEYLCERKAAAKWAFFGALGLVLVFDFFAERHEAHFFGDKLFCFWAMFAFVICLTMIVVCKWIAHAWLERDEDYYDN